MMAQKEMNPLAVSAFCESLAMMLQSGISPDEAAGLLAEDSCENDFHAAALAVQKPLLLGDTLASAMKQSGFFPPYCCQMVAAGEKAGRTESVLRSLSRYYESRDRMNRKLRSAVVYPMVLLLIMAAILAVLLAAVLPVFSGVYENLTGGVASSSFAYIQVSQIVGWVALAVTLVLGISLLVGASLSRSPKGRDILSRFFEKFPLTASASEKLAVSRFTDALSIFLASGLDTDTSMEAAAGMVSHRGVQKKLAACRADMENGKGLATAIYEHRVFEPLYGRMLVSGARSGSLDQVLARLSKLFSEDAGHTIDRLINSIEPVLTGFLTVAVGITLISIMLPLIGILGAIG